MSENRSRGWSPYLAGALVGLLAIASVYATTVLTGKSTYLGTSTTFVRAAGHIEQSLLPESEAAQHYYAKTRIVINWQFMLVIGIGAGALVAALTDHSFRLETVPPVWKRCFGNSFPVRAVGSFLGGILVLFGARMAGGCPSGHGLSGIMQLSLSGFAALCMFFISGCCIAGYFYRRRKKHG